MEEGCFFHPFLLLSLPLHLALFSTFSILLALYRRRPRYLPNNADGTAPVLALLVRRTFHIINYSARFNHRALVA